MPMILVIPTWLLGAAELVGRTIGWIARNPELRVASHERRAAFWYQRGVVLQARARTHRSERRKRVLYDRSARAFARHEAHRQAADEIARRHGLRPTDPDCPAVEPPANGGT